MEVVILFLLQLWNQPSVRMLGFGKDFSGFIPDPMTALISNPAYLKTFGKSEKSVDALQIYSMMQSFNTTGLDTQVLDLEFFEKKELISLFVLYPKIGLAYRVGAWQRWDHRNYGEFEPWAYGQEGFSGALNIGRLIKIGAEYNFSWNNGPDWIQIYKDDTIGTQQEASITHLEWSNEGGLGIIIENSANLHFSLSYKKNWEHDDFTADTTYWFWPQDEQTVFQDRRTYSHCNAKFRYRSERLSLTGQLDYFEEDREEWVFNYTYWGHSNYNSYRPGFGIIYQPFGDVFAAASIIYAINRHGSNTYARKLIVPVGFEKEFGSNLTFRFGSTFAYGYYYDTYFRFKNNINLGLDIRPCEKLCLHFATQNLLDDSQWFFGLSFAL